MTNFLRKPLQFLFFIVLMYAFLSCKKATTGKTFFVIGQDTTIVHNNLAHFFTTTNLKTTDSILIAKTASWGTGKVVYSIMIPDLKKGDIVMVKGEMKGITSENYNVAFNGYIILTNGTSNLPVSGISYYEITEDNGFNITPDIQHGVMTKFGTYVCQSNFTNMYINFCSKAYSSGANLPNDFLIINQDYGEMAVSTVVYRKLAR